MINRDHLRAKDEIRPQYQESTVNASAVFTSSLTRDLGPQYGVGSTIDALDTIEINEVGSTKELATPWYSDQILPFDITLAILHTPVHDHEVIKMQMAQFMSMECEVRKGSFRKVNRTGDEYRQKY